MAYSERINTYLTRLSAVTNANFKKKGLTDIINRLLMPGYKLTKKEADWINSTCQIWLGAVTSIAAGYTLTSRQRQTLRENIDKISSNISGNIKSNVVGNVVKNTANVTVNVAGQWVNVIGNVGFDPSNVTTNVASTSFKPAYSLNMAQPIVNKVIVNSQYSQYALPLTSAPDEDVADDMTGPPAAGPIDAADAMLDGLAEANVGFASSSLDEIDAAKATSCSTLGASATAFATSGLDQKTQPHISASPRSATPVGNDNGHVGQDEIENGRDARQRGGGGARHAGTATESVAPPLKISAAALLVGTSTVQVKLLNMACPQNRIVNDARIYAAAGSENGHRRPHHQADPDHRPLRQADHQRHPRLQRRRSGGRPLVLQVCPSGRLRELPRLPRYSHQFAWGGARGNSGRRQAAV